MSAIALTILLLNSNLSPAQGFQFPTTPQSIPKSLNLNFVKEFERDVAASKDDATLSRALLMKNQSLVLELKKTGVQSKGLSKIQAEKMNEFLINHPVAGEQAIHHYSKKNSSVGYCFGRATLAHLELLRRGVDAKYIRKIFIIGELKYNLDIWELHVATIVNKKGGGWWVLDGLFHKTLDLEDWYKEILKIAVSKKNPKVSLFLADPVKFLPISGAYNEKEMFIEEYNGFFKDLSAWLESHPVKKNDLIILF